MGNCIGVNRNLITLFAGLLRSLWCANLGDCAVVCAEQECARADHRFPGEISGWRSGFRRRGKPFWAGVAQLVEHLICNQRVGGSNPFASSI
jgi:hypothetical protein